RSTWRPRTVWRLPSGPNPAPCGGFWFRSKRRRVGGGAAVTRPPPSPPGGGLWRRRGWGAGGGGDGMKDRGGGGGGGGGPARGGGTHVGVVGAVRALAVVGCRAVLGDVVRTAVTAAGAARRPGRYDRGGVRLRQRVRVGVAGASRGAAGRGGRVGP